VLVTSCTEPLADLPKLVTTVGARLRRRLGSGKLAVDGSANLRGAVPSNLEARKLLAQAQVDLRAHDVKRAIELLQRSVASDPSCPLTHATLARAWLMIGHDRKAAGEAELAMQLADALPEQERLVIAALYYKASNQREQEIKTWSVLVDRYPDDPDLGLALANAQLLARKPHEALRTINRARLASTVGDDPRFDLEEARVRGLLSDLKQQEELAARAARRALECGAPLLAAEARTEQATALLRLGRYDEALQLSRTAASTMAENGNRVGVIRSKVLQGGVHYARGSISEGKEAQLEALAIAREIGNLRYIATALVNAANIEIDYGSLDVAEAYLQEALTAGQEVADPVLAGTTILSLASVLEQQGKIEAAEQAIRGALVTYRERDTTDWLADAEQSLCRLLRIQGRLVDARGFAEQALQHSRETRSVSDIERSLREVGNVCYCQGELDRAEACFEELHALAEETGQSAFRVAGLLGLSVVSLHRDLLERSWSQLNRALSLLAEQNDPVDLALGQLARCSLLLEEGKPGQAVQQAQQVRDELQRLESHENLYRPYLQMVMALVQQGRVVEARQAMSKARTCPLPAWNRIGHLDQELAAATVLLAENRYQQARQTATEVLEEARHIGHIPLIFEATLVLARTEQALGHQKQARERLQWLHEEATALGFHLIADKAAE
jgi:tetratricopeptide (TPR) repeat protein